MNSRLTFTTATSVLLTAFSATATAREMVSIAGDSVNMRVGAGTRFESKWELPKGYPLQVTARKGTWLKVRDFENDTGWVHRPLTNAKPHHIVKARVANIRSGPAINTRLVGRAENGEVLGTLETRPKWIKVQQTGGVRGWVSRELLWGW